MLFFSIQKSPISSKNFENYPDCKTFPYTGYLCFERIPLPGPVCTKLLNGLSALTLASKIVYILHNRRVFSNLFPFHPFRWSFKCLWCLSQVTLRKQKNP